LCRAAQTCRNRNDSTEGSCTIILRGARRSFLDNAMKGLYPKILLLVGGVFTTALTAAVVCLSVSHYWRLRRTGLADAAWTYDLALDALLILLVVLCSGLLALGLLTFYGLRRLVIHPLRIIQDGATAIGRGELNHRLHVHGGDELETLASAFNRMAEQLEVSCRRAKEQQHKVLRAIEASPVAIWVSDADRRLVLMNSALERLTGRGRERLLGRVCCTLMGVRTPDGEPICAAACPFQHPANSKGHVEGCLPTDSGGEIWVEISYSRIFDPDDHPLGVMCIMHDLTQRKELERLKDDFISMVSHELRTPLHHIKGFATTLLQTDVEWDAATQRDFLASIDREADRLTQLVSKMLDMSRLESGRMPMQLVPCLAHDLLESALRRVQGLAAGRPLLLSVPDDLPVLWVDDREIERVLINLIENAIKYSDTDTPIALSVEHRNDQAIFSVTDQGIGIAAEHLPRIFDRFYRVESGERRVAGTGLGLAICKRIVEAHRGQIAVESAPGRGACFWFSLPLGQQEIRAE
jgi:two-component system phosphate regulon sensor histidine kinase PhoR